LAADNLGTLFTGAQALGPASANAARVFVLRRADVRANAQLHNGGAMRNQMGLIH